MSETTFIITVDADKPDKRQQLSHGLDLAICFDGMRISAGEYEVTVKRLVVSAGERALLKQTLKHPESLHKKMTPAGVKLEERAWVISSQASNGCIKYTLTEEGQTKAEEYLAKEKAA